MVNVKQLALHIGIIIWGFVFVGMVLGIAVQPAQAQGDGYYISATPPAGYYPLDSRFYMTVINSTGVEQSILCNLAGFVMYADPGRQPDYFILRIDDLYVVEDWADPLNAYGGIKPGVEVPRFIPTDQLPYPTYFIFSPAGMLQFDVHPPHLG